MCGVQSSHLLGHFTSNCCGCLDTRLMMQPGLEIILMSLLIRKNSKIANFHCPHNTKYTQKYQFIQILVLLVKNICQDWSSKFFSPTVRSQENTFIIKSTQASQYLWHPTVAWPRDEGWSGQVSWLRWFFQEAGVRWVRWPSVLLLIIMTLCNTPGPLSSQVSRRVTGQPPL